VQEIIPYVSLDYSKMKKHFLNAKNQDIPYVLQALRWRISKSTNSRLKVSVLKTLIYYDIFGIAQNEKDLLKSLLFSKDEMVVEYSLRLINIFASESIGIVYLTKNIPQENHLIVSLCEFLQVEQSDTIIRQNIVGILQKLSVKSKAQQ